MTANVLRAAALALLLAAPAASRPAAAASCSVSVTAVGFGSYQAIATSPGDSSGAVALRCSATALGESAVSYAVKLSAGGSGGYAQRQLQGSGGSLAYNLFTSSQRVIVWGDGTDGTGMVGGSLPLPLLGAASRSHPVYGRLPAGQWVAPGLYGDSVVVTVEY